MTSASSTNAMCVACSPFGVGGAWHLESSGSSGKGAAAEQGLSWMSPASPSRNLAKYRLHIASAKLRPGLVPFVGCVVKMECHIPY
eukprot:719149-Pyramimonas_sp.AAC.1